MEAKNEEKHNGHKYCVVKPEDTKMHSISASYSRIQPDSPMIAHPSLNTVTRILTPSEHCNVRYVDGKLKDQVIMISEGKHPAQQASRTNAKAAHQMLGNSVTVEAWEAVGSYLGCWLNGLVKNKPLLSPIVSLVAGVPANSDCYINDQYSQLSFF